MRFNPLMNTDSYKYSHYLQYKPGTEYVHSYIESRGGEYDETVFFGLQAFIKEYLLKPFTQNDIEQAAAIAQAHGTPFNREGFEYILRVHNGFFPVRIVSVPEGTVVPVGNVLATVINTDPNCFWVTSFLETALLRAIWYPTTVATQSYHIKKAIKDAMIETCGHTEGIDFKLNDFGPRGASSLESSAIGGLGHLVSFQGTDNVASLQAAIEYYGATGPVGFSIPAAEHSTMTSWGGRDGELDAMRNMVNQFAKPGTLTACVSDSYDIFNAVSNYWGDELLEQVKASGGTIVVRPDSGDPEIMPISVIRRLMDKVGYTVNDQGYKVLPDYYRVIQGDGINPTSINKILDNMIFNGLSIENIAFGMGGGMLQAIDRDTLKFAMKCSSICINGEWSDVFKDPITDPGKSSKRGLLTLVKEDGEYKTVRLDDSWKEDRINVMNMTYSNGKLYNEQSFDEIRARAAV